MRRSIQVAAAMRAILAAAMIAGAAGCAHAPANPPSLTLAWRLEGLANPESILARPGGGYFLSLVGGEGDVKDANGAIAIVDAAGRLSDPAWASGLDAPKGMALVGGTLYVSDIDALVAIDAETGAVKARYPAAGARFLNDVAVLDSGAVLTSDSATSRIFVLQGEALEPWLADPALRAVNGLLPYRGALIVSTMAGRLLSIDPASKAITTLADGLGNADGIAPWGEGFLVSAWPGELFLVRGGVAERLLDTREDKRYLNDFILRDGLLLVPHWEPGALSAYRVAG
jgi:hypothetical protein